MKNVCNAEVDIEISAKQLAAKARILINLITISTVVTKLAYIITSCVYFCSEIGNICCKIFGTFYIELRSPFVKRYNVKIIKL